MGILFFITTDDAVYFNAFATRLAACVNKNVRDSLNCAIYFIAYHQVFPFPRDKIIVFSYGLRDSGIFFLECIFHFVLRNNIIFRILFLAAPDFSYFISAHFQSMDYFKALCVNKTN